MPTKRETKAAGTQGDATNNARLSFWLCNPPIFGRPAIVRINLSANGSPFLPLIPAVADEATVRRAFLPLHQSLPTSRQFHPDRRAERTCAGRFDKTIVQYNT
ncbi:unnamed protein product [Colias eurytheme]|nr:unnamed protein product [Colias eurytheme]